MQDYNRQANEYGPPSAEQQGASEQRVYRDFSDVREGEQISEDNKQKAEKPSRKRTDLPRSLASFLAATASVAVISTTVPALQSFIAPNEKISVEPINITSDSDDVFYELDVDSTAELDVVLYNDFVSQRHELSDGINKGAFEDLKLGVQYTLAVVKSGVLGESEIASWKIKTRPHAIENAMAEITAAGSDMESISFGVYSESDVPLSVVLRAEGYEERWELQNGMSEGNFDELSVGTEYTLSVEGEGPEGQRVIDEAKIFTKHPIDYTSAVVLEAGVDDGTENLLFYAVEASAPVDLSTLGLKVCLYDASGELVAAADFVPDGDITDDSHDTTMGQMNGSFTHIVYESIYTIKVEGIGVGDAPVVLTSFELSTSLG